MLVVCPLAQAALFSTTAGSHEVYRPIFPCEIIRESRIHPLSGITRCTEGER